MTLEQNEMLIVAAAAGGTMIIVFIGIVILIVRNGSKRASLVAAEEREARMRKRKELAEKEGRPFDELSGDSSIPVSTTGSSTVTPPSGHIVGGGADSTQIVINGATPSSRHSISHNPLFGDQSKHNTTKSSDGRTLPTVLSPHKGASSQNSPLSPELEKYSQSSSVNREGDAPLGGSVQSPSLKSDGCDLAKDMQVESFNSIEHTSSSY